MAAIGRERRSICVVNIQKVAAVDWENHIAVNPELLAGKPVIKGTRISVELIMTCFADGWSMDDVLESYPHLTREQVLAALRFVADIYKENEFVAIAKASA